jgi:hypothetical protein
MHATTMKIIHWIWGEPELADFLREIAEGDDFAYGDDKLLEMISSFVFPEDRERGIRAWIDVHGNEDRVQKLYEELTEGRKTPAGRLEWLSEAEPDLIRDALLGKDGDSDIYVHATAGHFHPNNRYRVDGKYGVYEMGWTSAAGFWSLAERDRQICPNPTATPCGCTVVRQDG